MTRFFSTPMTSLAVVATLCLSSTILVSAQNDVFNVRYLFPTSPRNGDTTWKTGDTYKITYTTREPGNNVVIDHVDVYMGRKQGSNTDVSNFHVVAKGVPFPAVKEIEFVVPEVEPGQQTYCFSFQGRGGNSSTSYWAYATWFNIEKGTNEGPSPSMEGNGTGKFDAPAPPPPPPTSNTTSNKTSPPSPKATSDATTAAPYAVLATLLIAVVASLAF